MTADEPMAGSGKIIELRQLLAGRHPQVRTGFSRERASAVWATGVSAVDRELGGGLMRGGLTEMVGEGWGSGTAQVLHSLVRTMARGGQHLAIVDGADSLDVREMSPAVLSRLLWVRCGTAEQALKAADIVLRDRNIPLVVLDLKMNPAWQLGRIPSSVWYRYLRWIEPLSTTLLVVTPQPMVGAASMRIRLRGGAGIDAVLEGPDKAVSALEVDALRKPVAMDADTGSDTDTDVGGKENVG